MTIRSVFIHGCEKLRPCKSCGALLGDPCHDIKGNIVYAHTVNDYLTLGALRESGVSGVYTDWLSPRDEQRPPRAGPLPEWELETAGHTELAGRTAAFLPPAGAGFTTRFDIANEAEHPVWLRFEVVNALGLSTETHERVVAAGDAEEFDLGEVAARAQGWIRYTAPAELLVEPRWIYRGRDIEWAFGVGTLVCDIHCNGNRIVLLDWAG